MQENKDAFNQSPKGDALCTYTHEDGRKEVYAVMISGQCVPTMDNFMTLRTYQNCQIDRAKTIAMTSVIVSVVAIGIAITALMH